MCSSLQPSVLQADIEDEALRYLRFADMAAASRGRDVARGAAARRNGGNTNATLGRPAGASRLWKVVRATPLPSSPPPKPPAPLSPPCLPSALPPFAVPLYRDQNELGS